MNRDDEAEKTKQGRRDDCTVMVQSLHHSADEKAVYVFFQACGKVRDVQVIRDPNSGKSKGIAFVEFYLPESVLTALEFNGQMMGSNPIVVQAVKMPRTGGARDPIL